jgi:hypothetical protein
VSIVLYEGEAVRWAGWGDIQAEGNIVALASSAAHIKWSSGPNAGDITFTDLYDIEPVTARKVKDEDPLHLVAVRNAYDDGSEAGVLNFLAVNSYTGSWSRIASDVLAYTQQRIRADASMELVDEQLSIPEKQKVVAAAALALLSDAFGTSEEGE